MKETKLEKLGGYIEILTQEGINRISNTFYILSKNRSRKYLVELKEEIFSSLNFQIDNQINKARDKNDA